MEDRAPCFNKVTEYNNISFDHKVVEDKDSKKDGKEVVINLEEEASKKKAYYKTKRNAVWALLLATMLRLFALISIFILIPGLSIAMPKLSAAIPGLSAVMPRLFVAMPGSFATMCRRRPK